MQRLGRNEGWSWPLGEGGGVTTRLMRAQAGYQDRGLVRMVAVGVVAVVKAEGV